MEVLLVVIAGLAAIFARAALLFGLCIGTTTAALVVRSAGRPARPLTRRLWQALATAAVFSALALAALRSFALTKALSKDLDGPLAQLGYDLQIGDAELSLLSGTLSLHKLRLRSTDGVGLTITRVVIDVDWSSILREQLQLKELQIEGVVGRFAPKPGERDATPPRARNFIAQHMVLSDTELVIAGQNDPLGHHLRIDRIEVQPLRSDYLLYDLLVASEGLLRVDDRIVRIDRDGIWSATGVPITAVKTRLGPPFSALRSGTVDITLDPGRDRTGKTAAKTTFNLRLRLYDADLGNPQEFVASERAAATALQRALEARDSIALEVHLPIRAALLQNTLHLTGSKLEAAASRALVNALIRSARTHSGRR